jgi:hypothetical protein
MTPVTDTAGPPPFPARPETSHARIGAAVLPARPGQTAAELRAAARQSPGSTGPGSGWWTSAAGCWAP